MIWKGEVIEVNLIFFKKIKTFKNFKKYCKERETYFFFSWSLLDAETFQAKFEMWDQNWIYGESTFDSMTVSSYFYFNPFYIH